MKEGYHVLIPRYIYILEPKRYCTVAIRLSYTTIYTSFIYCCLFLCNDNTILTFKSLYLYQSEDAVLGAISAQLPSVGPRSLEEATLQQQLEEADEEVPRPELAG
jgi:hypothetical protein